MCIFCFYNNWAILCCLGICTFQDCDVTFKFIRSARLLRDLDFARYHFYDRTGIFQRSQDLKIKSLQGCTLILIADPVPLFSFYKINTKVSILFNCYYSLFNYNIKHIGDKLWNTHAENANFKNFCHWGFFYNTKSSLCIINLYHKRR